MYNITYITGYTPHEAYVEGAKKLEASVLSHDLKFRMFPMPDTGSWEKNCQQKAGVILKAMEMFNTPIVWIDADAIMVRPPLEFNNLNCDVAYYTMIYPCKHLASGTLYFNNTPAAKAVLRKWIDDMLESYALDQRILQNVLWDDFGNKIDCCRQGALSVEYCRIFDSKAQDEEMTGPPVIIHYQASRSTKQLQIRKYRTYKGAAVLLCGNGGSLPEHYQYTGEAKYDFVMRLNNYKITENVGHRCDIWCTSFWPDISDEQIIANRNRIVWDCKMFGKLYPYEPAHKQHVLELLKKIPENVMGTTDFSTLRMVSGVRSPSTGLTAVQMVVNAGMHPTLIGFDFFNGAKYNHHYYDAAHTKQCPHVGNIEKIYLESLEREGKVSIVR